MGCFSLDEPSARYDALLHFLRFARLKMRHGGGGDGQTLETSRIRLPVCSFDIRKKQCHVDVRVSICFQGLT
jgi:hypothetical protein